MSLVLWDQSQPPPRRVRVLELRADMFLHMLRSLNGFDRVQATGIPDDARVVGITTDAVWNTVQLYVESEAFPECLAEEVPGRLTVDFSMWSGDAYPEREKVPA